MSNAGALGPRVSDCDPSTDFNLCALEREYSIETARRLHFVSGTEEADDQSGPRTSRFGHPLQRRDLCLIGRPLHTRSTNRVVTTAREAAIRSGHGTSESASVDQARRAMA